jgi:hypothetical protein
MISVAYLYVEGVGRRLPSGFEIHWNWVARRDGKKIDGGALTGGDLPEFYVAWPDYSGTKAIIRRMEKIMQAWMAAGEFAVDNLAPKINVSLRQSNG